jgi:predicted secreted protein
MRALLLAALLACAPFSLRAQEQNAPAAPAAYNTVELQAEVHREIANDTLNAVLFIEASDANPARLADLLNKAASDALKIAADVKAVRARSGAQHSYPVYDRSQKLTGWRGRSEIRLESRDFQAASALIGKLQSTLQLSSLSFSVAPETRRQAENELIADAVKAFRARADIARAALGGKGYRLRRMAINTSGSAPPPRPMMRAMAASASPEVAAPQFEGGLSSVTVSVSGAIEVQ